MDRTLLFGAKSGASTVLMMSTLPLSDDFLLRFKRQTEANWVKAVIDRSIFGFQFQAGSRWIVGLDEEGISDYERAVQARFPDDFRRFLRFMNGTDLPTLNVYACTGEPHRTAVGVYSYPRDLEIVRSRMKDVAAERKEIEAVLGEQDFELRAGDLLVPIYGHRFVVCGSDLKKSVVLSICGSDAIVYGMTLRAYLQAEFLSLGKA